ncbi:MAG: hypothetical protein ACOCVX_05580, partial [Bacteroidales bacterium]
VNGGIFPHPVCQHNGKFPEHPVPYINRGLSKISIGDKEGGCLDFSKAAELGFEPAFDKIEGHCN